MTGKPDDIIGIYQRHAHAWASRRSRSLFEKPWLDRFLALSPPSASILDIGCGCADPIARYFIEQGHRVTGVDTSPGLVESCKARFPTMDWIVADMRSLALNRCFDGVLAWDSFFHLCPDDQIRMFGIFREHAAFGAGLMFTSGPKRGEAIGAFMGEPLYHASLDPHEYSSLLDEFGFDIVSYVAEDPACGGHTVWLAQSRRTELPLTAIPGSK
jgi:SAM-dependent methyltransferase